MNRQTTTTTTRNHVNYKCHYCNKGADRTVLNTRSTNAKSKSLERGRRLVSANPQTRSTSVISTYLPPLVPESEYSYTPGTTLTEDDLRQELVELKRRYAVLTREHGILKTHYRATTNEVKRKEMEIENLLQDPITKTKSQAQLELNSLKRKLIQRERALREKSDEIADLLRDKNISNAVGNREKLIKLKKEYAQLKKMLEKSVPHAELEAEKARLAELIDSLQRENDGLHQTLATVLPEEETDTILDGKGLSDAKTLAKLRNEAAARRQEVEHYQNLLTTLIRDKTPLPVYSESHVIESPEVPKKSNPSTKKRHSSKSKRSLPPITVESPASSKLESTPNGDVVPGQPDEHVVNGIQSKVVTTTLESPPTETPKPIQNKDKEEVVQVEGSQNNAEKLSSSTSELNSKKPKQHIKEFHKLKTIKEVPISPSLPSPSLLMSPPVKMVNSPLKYVELSSPEMSPRIDTPPEQMQHLQTLPNQQSSHGTTQGIHTPQLERNFKEFDSDAAETDSNIGAIAAEYRERDMDERVDLLVIALKCQLLREEMLQTRVMSF